MLSNNSYMTITCLAQAAHCYFQCRESMTAISRFQEAENIAKRGFGITSMAQFLIGTNGAHYCDAIMSVLEEYAWASHITCPGKTVMSDDQRASMLSVRQELEGRTQLSQQHLNEKSDPHTNALDCLTLARTALICAVLQSEPSLSSQSNPDPMGRPDIAKPDILQARIHLDEAITLLYSANQLHLIPAGLLVQSWLCYCEGKPVESLEALNEAWDIAVRGPMRLHIADIHLHRARLFFREEHYPWDSPKADLDAAEKLINECGYHRRDQELADAKHAILGTS